MKRVHEEAYEDMPGEIDFSGAVRGRYVGKVQPLDNLVLIEPELFASFPSAEAVNEALRILKRAGSEAARMQERPQQAKAS